MKDEQEKINEAATRYATHPVDTGKTDFYGKYDKETKFVTVEYAAFRAGVDWAKACLKSPWISVHSSQPKDFKELLRTFNGIITRDKLCTVNVIARAEKGDKAIFIMAYMYYDKDSYTWKWESLVKATGETYYITHWMPIPEFINNI